MTTMEPQPGTYKTRLPGKRWKDAPHGRMTRLHYVWVPVLIRRREPVTEDGEPIDRADARAFTAWPPLLCLVDGAERDADHVWPYLEPITWAEYHYMTADAEWCRAYAPDQPRAKPRDPIDLENVETF